MGIRRSRGRVAGARLGGRGRRGNRPGPAAALLWGAVAVAGLGVLTACGSAAAQTPAAKPTPEVTPAALMIGVADLPEGWRQSNSRGTGYRVSVCGVDLEPVEPLAVGNQRFAKSGFGPFLEQYVRVYDGATAQEVIDKLRAALPTCTSFSVPRDEGSSETVEVSVEPIEIAGAGEDSVAWRQTAQTEKPTTSEVLLTRVGKSAVLFTSYALTDDLDPQLLVDALAATKAKA